MELQLCCCCLFCLWNLRYSSNTTTLLHALTPTHQLTPSLPLVFFTAQQLLRISPTRDKKVWVAKRGFSISSFSIARPFSLVATEHMAPFHMLTTVPTAEKDKEEMVKLTAVIEGLPLCSRCVYVCVSLYTAYR